MRGGDRRLGGAAGPAGGPMGGVPQAAVVTDGGRRQPPGDRAVAAIGRVLLLAVSAGPWSRACAPDDRRHREPATAAIGEIT
jgi:hypothetical protein